MIEIIKGRICWVEGYHNPPGLELLLSHQPALSEHRFEQREDCYYSEVDGVCQFFSWGGRPDRGYGGHTFHITMVDGSERDLVGPWSSSPSAMNLMGFGPCTDASVTDEPDTYERGYTFYASAVTMEMLGGFRDRIEVPPFRFRREEPWAWHSKGFSHRLVFPEGSRFTMLQADVQGNSTKGPIRFDRQASSQQGALLGGAMQRFVPIVELPDGTYWVKPTSGDDVPVPACCTVEELGPNSPGYGRMYAGGPKS